MERLSYRHQPDMARGVRPRAAETGRATAGARAPEPSDPGLRIEIASDLARLADLRGPWTELSRRTPRAAVFQSWNWCEAWWRHVHVDSCNDRELRVLTCWRDERLVLVWPLVRCTRHPRCLVPAGAPLTQYADVLIDPDADPRACLERAWREILSWRDIDAVLLRKVRADSPLAGLLADRAARVGERERAPYLDLAAHRDWRSLRGSLRARSRKQLDRFARRMANAGTVAFRVAEPGPEAAALVARAFAQKRAWLERTGRFNDVLSHDVSTATLGALAAGPNDDLGCHVAALTMNDAPVAIEIGLSQGGHYCSFLGSFALDHAHLRPGNVEIENMIRWTLERGFATYDMLAPEDSYKSRWSSGSVAVDDLAVPLTAAGRLYVGVFLRHVRPRLKTLYYALPAGLRARLLTARGCAAE